VNTLFKEVLARVDVIVLASDRTIGCDYYLASQEENALIKLGFTSYGHCLRDDPMTFPSRTTLQVLAAKILATYDCKTNPVNGMVVGALQTVHMRMLQAVADKVMLKVPVMS